MELKYQTKEQFMARLAAKTEEGGDIKRYLVYIHKATQAGDITDKEITDAFAMNISTWDKVKGVFGFAPTKLAKLKSMAKAVADAEETIRSNRSIE